MLAEKPSFQLDGILRTGAVWDIILILVYIVKGSFCCCLMLIVKLLGVEVSPTLNSFPTFYVAMKCTA